MVYGKGWHEDYSRHSEARLYGRASGTRKLSAPRMKGMSKKQIEQEYNVVSKPEFRTYKYTSKEEQAEFEKERKEHPSFTDKQVEQIVVDHEAEEKEHREKVVAEEKEIVKRAKKLKKQFPEITNEEALRSARFSLQKESKEESRQKALYFKKELLKEARKKNPDPQAVAYYRQQFLYYKRMTGKTYFVPVFKK